MYYSLEPEVAGGIGEDSVLDTTSHPPNVSKLHYEMDGWLGDELLESFPCFIVTKNLREIIERVDPTGLKFASVKISTTQQFDELYPGRELPKFYWLKINGIAGKDDFGISSSNSLVVSKRIFETIRSTVQLNNCDVEEFLE